MDFWNRLIGGSSSSNTHKAPPPATPEQRLARFKRIWQSLLHSWRNSRENDPATQENLRLHIKRLTHLLLEEEKRSERLCMNFCYEQQVFIAISKIGQSGAPAVISECIVAFSTLIDNEDEDFLAQESFAVSLIAFLRKTAQRSNQAFEGEFVELLFSIAAKIRLSPGILGVWFTSRSGGEGGSEFESLGPQQKFAGITNKEDFPLFYLLIDFVHHEGRVGDFARTGLLYIIEAASSSVDLERWIVESDLATLMASGLGALYSQLSRKLVVTYPTEDPPAILTLSDYSSTPPTFGAESSNSPEFQTHLETFLSYLIFWQDVLEHCKSSEVKQTLLDHFQVLFLQQLLYPSLLESSDIDGGSSVAVLTYVHVILDTLEHPDIIHLILSYLMALPDKPKRTTPSSHSVARRRKSLDLLTKVTDLEDKPTPDLFNLIDLVLTSLKSRSQQTVSATLRLVSTILRKHHPYSISTLLKIVPVTVGAPARTIGAHNKEMDMLFTLVSEISEDDNVAVSYEDHLKDNLILLESHPCSGKILAIRNSINGYQGDCPNPSSGKLRDMYTHTIHPNDPLLKSVVDLLSTFFSNTVETNLILTCVVVDLAACSWMRPEGWLLFDPANYEFEEDVSDLDSDSGLSDMEEELASIMGHSENGIQDLLAAKEKRRIKAIKAARREPAFSKNPPVIAALQDLVKQIHSYRREIPDLDDKLHERRRAFKFTDELNEALLSSHSPPPQPQAIRNPVLDSMNIRNLINPSSSSTSSSSPAAAAKPATRPKNTSISSGNSTPTRAQRAPSKGVMSPSPDRGISPAPAPNPGPGTAANASPSSPFGSHVADTTQRRIKILVPLQGGIHLPPPPEGESQEGSVVSDVSATTPTNVTDSPAAAGGDGGDSFGGGIAGTEFTLSHLLTNIMILQEFVLELAALTQVRASLFGDIKFA